MAGGRCENKKDKQLTNENNGCLLETPLQLYIAPVKTYATY